MDQKLAYDFKSTKSALHRLDTLNCGIRGFTMIEMVAVMAIMAILAALVVPRFETRSSPSTVRAKAFEMAAILRGTRLAALEYGTESTFVLDLSARTAGNATGKTASMSIPPDIRITHQVSTRCIRQGRRIKVVFLPDGRSCGSQITLSIDGLSAVIQTDWLAGKSKVSFL